MPSRATAFWIAIVVMTGVLIWGLSIIKAALQKSDGQQPLVRSILAAPKETPDDPEKGSFSRTAGATGAMALAAATVGISYWVVYDLFDNKGAELPNLKGLEYYFLSGGALFAPYAISQLTSVFRPTGPAK